MRRLVWDSSFFSSLIISKGESHAKSELQATLLYRSSNTLSLPSELQLLLFHTALSWPCRLSLDKSGEMWFAQPFVFGALSVVSSANSLTTGMLAWKLSWRRTLTIFPPFTMMMLPFRRMMELCLVDRRVARMRPEILFCLLPDGTAWTGDPWQTRLFMLQTDDLCWSFTMVDIVEVRRKEKKEDKRCHSGLCASSAVASGTWYIVH